MSIGRLGCCDVHDSRDHGKVIRTPRLYDWLVRAPTFGGERRFRRWTIDLADLQPGERVLDVGCGTGTLLIEAARRVGASGAAHGIEPSHEMVAFARRKAERQGIAISVLEGSADRLPFPDASFDVVFCTMVLHHLPPAMRSDAIGEMRRALRVGGRLVLVDLKRPETVSAALSLVTLFHRARSSATSPDGLDVKGLLSQHGFDRFDRHAALHGAVGAFVGRRDP